MCTADTRYGTARTPRQNCLSLDYLRKSCVTVQTCFTHVSFALFHPNLPIIVSGSEDGTVKIWNSGTYRIGNRLSYTLERVHGVLDPAKTPVKWQ